MNTNSGNWKKILRISLPKLEYGSIKSNHSSPPEVLQSNFNEIAPRHGCFPVNLLYIFRTPFTRDTSEGLLGINESHKLFQISIIAYLSK